MLIRPDSVLVHNVQGKTINIMKSYEIHAQYASVRKAQKRAVNQINILRALHQRLDRCREILLIQRRSHDFQTRDLYSK